jgi:hypothetical protein
VPAEPLIQHIDMGNAVQERQHVAGRRHGRRDRRHRGIEIIGFAGQEHRVIHRRHLRRDHRLCCYLRIPERALDPQPLFGETLAPSFTDQKRDISPALREAAAEIPASAAGTEHQNLGLAHNALPSFHPIADRITSPRLPHVLEAGIERKLDPNAARLLNDEMDLRAGGPNSTTTPGQFDIRR